MRMSLPTTGRELERARAMGLVTTEKRQTAGGANTHKSMIMSARTLDDATEAGRIVKVDVKLSKAIAQARTSMKLSQRTWRLRSTLRQT
ncbi:hypothetical protein MHU86_12990 [Fragilaria crotonensis]|nr:hypothetical protein MHU86_12990 [Fragilaria crotonensis]